jgi:hypothetical protein
LSDRYDASAATQALHEAAELIRDDPNRSGSLLRFGSAGQVVMTGDMHGNLKNFEKLQRFCDLRNSPGRIVVLHELIHQEVGWHARPDTSIDLLVRAAAWKCAFPDNVFFLQSNHELAQLRGQEITKAGRSVLGYFDQGVALRYGAEAGPVLAGVHDYLAALPLAARTDNGIFLAHSLPDPLSLDDFDFSVLERTPDDADLSPGGAAYALVWGRFQSLDMIGALAQRLNVDAFIVGHTPQESGYAVVGRMIILASDHEHGVFLPFDLSKRYTVPELERNIRKFVSVP